MTTDDVWSILDLINAGQGIYNDLNQNEHAKEYIQAMEILNFLSDGDPRLHITEDYYESKIAEALFLFSKVDATDKLYLQCDTWYRMAYCHAFLGQFDKSDSCLRSITNAKIRFIYTLQPKIIKDLQKKVPQAEEEINEIRTILENRQKEEENRQKEQQERDDAIEQIIQEWGNLKQKVDAIGQMNEDDAIVQIKEELEKVRKEGKRRRREVVVMAVLLVAMIALVCYNNFM